MKILKIAAKDLPLFNGICEIDFLPQQRVNSENAENMSELFSTPSNTFYKNNVISFTGINASGKTSVLKLITFVFGMLNNIPINSITCSEVLDGIADNNTVSFDTFFFSETQNNKSVYLLNTVIAKENNKLKIVSETLKSKDISKIKAKKALYDFSDIETNFTRDVNSEFLLDDVSIMVAFNKRNKESINYTDMLRYTNINELDISEDCPVELISFFDPSIEYLKINKEKNKSNIHLKFKSKNEMILNQFSELNRYLSSGTIKGINTFLYAIRIFNNGGYLIIDELENHFNREIVSTLIRFYMDKKVNKKGATLIFSTHYSELLDEFERNDNIYIVRNRQGITIENLSKILKRNDIKKSEAYQSGLLGGTLPMYDAYMNLKNAIISDSI
jgi:energy-coupling factor transporter ATP-binding protein EcfA2|nr:AAA family ATPase [Ruminococcus bromii]